MATILILEDDASICMLLSRVFSAQGHRVLVAADGREAAQRIAEGQPDLVISDINLPGRSGPEVIASALPAGIPVLFISGNGSRSVLVADRSYPVISKPFDVFELASEVDATLAPLARVAA